MACGQVGWGVQPNYLKLSKLMEYPTRMMNGRPWPGSPTGLFHKLGLLLSAAAQ